MLAYEVALGHVSALDAAFEVCFFVCSMSVFLAFMWFQEHAFCRLSTKPLASETCWATRPRWTPPLRLVLDQLFQAAQFCPAPAQHEQRLYLSTTHMLFNILLVKCKHGLGRSA